MSAAGLFSSSTHLIKVHTTPNFGAKVQNKLRIKNEE